MNRLKLANLHKYREGPPVCDKLNITIIEADYYPFLPTLLEFLSGYPGYHITPGHYTTESGAKVIYGKAFKGGGQWYTVVFHGQFLELVREANQVGYLYQLISEIPHRVTAVDIAQDYQVDPAQLQALLVAKVKRGVAYHGKTRFQSQYCQEFRAASLYDSEHVSGGFYLQGKAGRRGFQAVIYDKRNRILQLTDHDIGRHRARIEIKLKHRDGITISDYASPEPCYYKHMSPGIIPVAPHIRDWSQGIMNQPRYIKPDREPAEKIEAVLRNSHDLKRAITEAQKMPEEQGLAILQGTIYSMYINQQMEHL